MTSTAVPLISLAPAATGSGLTTAVQRTTTSSLPVQRVRPGAEVLAGITAVRAGRRALGTGPIGASPKSRKPSRLAIRVLRAAHPNIVVSKLQSSRIDADGEIERVAYADVAGGIAYLVNHETREVFAVPAARSTAVNLRSIRDGVVRPIVAPRRRSRWTFRRVR